ncbi:hypothetical protein YC2023_088626 [Brassica napus]
MLLIDDQELMQFSTQESDIAAAANEALKRFRDESKKRFCSGGHGIQLPHRSNVSAYINMLFDSLRNYLPKTVIYYKVREAMISLNFFYAHVDRKELAALLSPLLTRRTKSTFVVTPPANVTETLIKEIPVQYSGNERDDDTKFSNEADSPMKLFLKLSLSLGHL